MNRLTLTLAMVVVVTACSSPEKAADSTLADLPVDTLKPVYTSAQEDSIRDADSVRAVDSLAAAESAKPKAQTFRPRPAPAPTKSDSLSPNIGRDSVIRGPLRRLPADTNPR